MNATPEVCWKGSFKVVDCVLECIASIQSTLGGKMVIALDFNARVHNYLV